MTGGRSPRRKGDSREREFAAAIGGQRVPLSGAQEGYPGDVKALGLTWQVKARANGFRTLHAALDSADALALKADRLPWLVVLPLDRFREMVK